MIGLAVRTLRFRKGAFAAAFIAMVLGAAIVMACGGLMETGIRTSVPPQRLAGADIVVVGDQRYEAPGSDDESAILSERVRLDDDLVDAIAAVPGVRSAEGQLIDPGPRTGAVDAIAVTAEPGVELARLEQQIDGALDGAAITLVGDDRGLAEFPRARASSESLVTLAGVFGGWAIMVSMFGVASMLALSIQQRRKELALLRAVGATPGQLRRMVLGETLLLSVMATALAYLPGSWLGRFLFERMADSGVVSPAVAFHQGWLPTVVAVGAATIAAVGGALVAGRRAGRIRPTQALTEVTTDGPLLTRPRVVFGLLFLSGGVALGVVTVTVMSGPLTSSTAGPAAILWAIGLAMFSPALTRFLTRVLQRPVRTVSGLAGELAVLNVQARTARMAAVVTPVILLVGVGTSTLYLQATEDFANRQAFTDGLVADAVVTATGGVGADLVERVDDLPGVAGASLHVRSTGFIESPRDRSDEGRTLVGVSADGVEATAPVSLADGALTDLRGESVALATDHAAELGVDVGDTVTTRFGDGTAADLEVVALFSAADDYDALLVPASLLAGHTTPGQAREILVKAEAGTDTSSVVEALHILLAGEPGLAVTDRDALFAGQADQQRTLAFANYTVVAMIVAYTAISVINTLVSSTSARRQEFGLQRLTGATRRQVMQMVGVEGGLVAVIGVVLGTFASIATLVPFSVSRIDTVMPEGSPLIYAGVVAAALALTLGATLAPGWMAMRGRPAEAAVSVD